MSLFHLLDSIFHYHIGNVSIKKNYTHWYVKKQTNWKIVQYRYVRFFIHIIRFNNFFFLTTDSYFLLDRTALCKVQRCYKMISVCLCLAYKPMELINHPPVRIYSSVCIFFTLQLTPLLHFRLWYFQLLQLLCEVIIYIDAIGSMLLLIYLSYLFIVHVLNNVYRVKSID